MFCPNCGNVLNDELFCPNCGCKRELEQQTTPEENTYTPINDTFDPMSNTTDYVNEMPYIGNTTYQVSGGNKLKYGLVLAGSIISLACCGIFELISAILLVCQSFGISFFDAVSFMIEEVTYYSTSDTTLGLILIVGYFALDLLMMLLSTVSLVSSTCNKKAMKIIMFIISLLYLLLSGMIAVLGLGDVIGGSATMRLYINFAITIAMFVSICLVKTVRKGY